MAVAILLEGVPRGELSAEERGLYTLFRAEITGRVLSRLTAVFEGGARYLGVPVPEGENMVLRTCLPTSRLPPGRLLRGELRREGGIWEQFGGGQVGKLLLPAGERQGELWRFPWSPGEALPADELLCFYRYGREGERTFLELRLDADGRPRMFSPETGHTASI